MRLCTLTEPILSRGVPLPKFKYHPDPVATGSVKATEESCICCGRARGFIYVGSAYAEDELDEQICPWCIADGSAHSRFDASFTDEAGGIFQVNLGVLNGDTDRNGWRAVVIPFVNLPAESGTPNSRSCHHSSRQADPPGEGCSRPPW